VSGGYPAVHRRTRFTARAQIADKHPWMRGPRETAAALTQAAPAKTMTFPAKPLPIPRAVAGFLGQCCRIAGLLKTER
jgi:hypothetical protein